MKSNITTTTLYVITALVAAALLASCAEIAPHARPENLRIIDAHNHLNGDLTEDRLLGLMDAAGVKGMVLMARYYKGAFNAGDGTDEQAASYAARHPGRFIPFVAGQRGDLGPRNRQVWEGPSDLGDSFLASARQKLESGAFRGIGEFIIRHYAYSSSGSEGGGGVDLPLDSFLMARIAALGAEFRVPVLIHLEAEPAQVEAMERLLAAHPKTTFIWAHNCGRGSAVAIGEFLSRFPHLMCDLGGMTADRQGGYGTFWPRRTPWIHLVEDGTGKLYPEMRKLFERFPRRFMVGTDCAHTPALDTYLSRIERFRVWLSQLTPGAARRIGYENAAELFGLK
ncbi:amidohydrolase family protein [Nitrospinota bacterium]